MAGAKPTQIVQLKRVVIPEELICGSKVVKWEEDPTTSSSPPPPVPCTLSIDSNGFYLSFTNQHSEVELLDTSLIRDVRTGRGARLPKDSKLRSILHIGENLELKSLTVVHGSDFVSVNYLNFVCTSSEVVQLWSSTLSTLAHNLLHLNSSAMSYLLKAHTRLQLQLDTSSRVQIGLLLKWFSKEDRERVKKSLEGVGLPSDKGTTLPPSNFTFPTFFNFYLTLTQRSEVHLIFNQLTNSKLTMTTGQFMDFLNNEQRDPRLNEILYPYTTLDRAADLIQIYEQDVNLAKDGKLTLEGFLRYLLSDENGIVSLERYELADDLSQPLNHYFINSSHNTYLTGHQLAGKSSVEIYRQALLAGCRCVELDFWNGKEEPNVVHGYTLVPDIPAKDVIEAIADSAFKTSPLPVILSFENHCNQKQQAKIAQYCRDYFGDMLLDLPLEKYPLSPGQPLPPPEQLLRRILIKNKKYKSKHQKSAAAAAEVEEDSSSSSDSESESNDDSTNSSSQRESAASTEISSLVNYIQPVHFHGFEHALLRQKSYEMTSFDEKQAAGLLKERPVEFVDYNKIQITRVYPKGTRVDSSNFMPHLFWNAGCQLVALNYQTLDLGMQLNLGIFEQNARSGYLLKPECMRLKQRRFDPFAENTVDGIIAGMVTVRVLSGQFLCDKKVGIYIEVEMYGLPTDTVRGRFKTKVVQNGVNPVWWGESEEAFVFKKVVLPELATLRIAAYEENGKLIGHRVLPVLALRPGYRHCILRNELGQPLLSTLFLQIKVQDFVPDGLSELAAALANPIKAQSEREKRERQMNVFRDSVEEEEGENMIGSQVVMATQTTIPSPINTSLLPQKQASIKQQKHIDVKSKSVEGVATQQQPPMATKSNSIETELEPTIQELHAEPLAKFWEGKLMKEKRVELEKKVESLRKKHDKERGKKRSSLVKRVSSKNLGEGAGLLEEQIGVEREALERGWEEIFSSLEKSVKSSQSNQIKLLKSYEQSSTSGIMKKLSSERKEEVRKLSKKTKEKNELDRLKREVTTRLVEKGVSERSKMEKSYNKLQELLKREQEEVLRELQEKRRVIVGDLSNYAGEQLSMRGESHGNNGANTSTRRRTGGSESGD